MPLMIQFRLSRVALSLCLARMVVEDTLLERSEWIRPSRESDRSMQNGEAKGELRSHSSHVRVFNTCNTRMHLLRMT